MPSTIPDTYPETQGGYTAPPNYSSINNIQQAQAYSSSHTTAETYWWFYNQVRNGGPWDYKQISKQTGVSYEGLGNWNYAVTGTAAGIPEEVLLRMAGLAQRMAGTSKSEWGNPFGGPPYGDDPLDQDAIKRGIDWARSNGYAPPPSSVDLTLPFGDPFTGMPWPNTIDPQTGIDFNKATAWRRKDPLTLDLDGDGIETIAPSSTNPIYFDHDADGIKTGTGWISADDGFLVLDRNGNGTIDDGNELFGDSTTIHDAWSGRTCKAADGFAALLAEDTTQGGKVDSADANWNQLRVWRDLNQDGVSQADELFTLDALNIESFSATKTANSQTLASGNEIADLGSYTKTDGTQGTMGTVNKMADVNLIEDTFHRVFTDQIPLVEGVAALPEMQGSGKVRDLHEAVNPDNVAHIALRNKRAVYVAVITRTKEQGLLDDLIAVLGAISGMTSIGINIVKRQLIAKLKKGRYDEIFLWNLQSNH